MLTSEFNCPECKRKCSKDIEEVFKTYSKELYLCKGCDTHFVIEHKASVSTQVFTINK